MPIVVKFNISLGKSDFMTFVVRIIWLNSLKFTLVGVIVTVGSDIGCRVSSCGDKIGYSNSCLGRGISFHCLN